jgi:hypothetical protein
VAQQREGAVEQAAIAVAGHQRDAAPADRGAAHQIAFVA